jgi:SAM-dependent methyltransferase
VEQYTATDYSAEMIAIAREKQAETDLENLDFRVGKVGNNDLPEGLFDAVLSFNVLHLLPDRQLALKEIFDLLRPGGLFISKTPCLGGVYRLLQPVLAALQLFGKAAKAGIPQTRFS